MSRRSSSHADDSVNSESDLEASGRTMSGRSTRSNPANNTNPPNETTYEVARQLNTAMPNSLTQLVQALRCNRANQGDVTQSCSYKTFRSCGAKEFFGTEGAVGLLTWFENMKFVLHIKCCEHGQPLTTDGIKDGIFKKKENAGNKKRSNDQFKNQGMNDRNKRQRTGRNFAITTPDQGQGQRQAINERPRPTCYECGDPNHFRKNCLKMNQATTSGGNRPNPVLTIEGNPNQRNNRNQARGRAFALGVAEAPQDPNVVTGTFSLNDHFATVLFDSGTDYSFISINFLSLIDMKTSVINPGYEIKIANVLKVETNKIIQGCRLELEGHTFIIDLIPLGHDSFDVIVGMDWFS
ncbi:putative reverse transcriptase domain-containing protein [Tanacetum coccineum]